MRVVGESHYQPALRQMRGRCVPGPDGRPSFPVALVAEPHNPHDENAVAVLSDAGCVGYLPREDARRYAPTLRSLRREGYDGGACTALLNGGTRDKPSFGITLRVAYPEVCELRLGLRAPDGKPQAGRVRGRHYSDYAEEVKRLRRAGQVDVAEALLLELVEAAEEEAEALGAGVAPWYYEQLAIIYRKRKDFHAEVRVLERYERQPAALGTGPQRLAERHLKARALRDDAASEAPPRQDRTAPPDPLN